MVLWNRGHFRGLKREEDRGTAASALSEKYPIKAVPLFQPSFCLCSRGLRRIFYSRSITFLLLFPHVPSCSTWFHVHFGAMRCSIFVAIPLFVQWDPIKLVIFAAGGGVCLHWGVERSTLSSKGAHSDSLLEGETNSVASRDPLQQSFQRIFLGLATVSN